MKRLYCKHEFKYYTFLKEIMLDLDLVDKDYWWLISDIEAYPRKSETKELLNQNSHLLLTAKELVEILEKDDFQWIWAVFSVIPFLLYVSIVRLLISSTMSLEAPTKTILKNDSNILRCVLNVTLGSAGHPSSVRIL